MGSVVQSITIRIVFDGAPLAGKTTAAYSLGEALGEVAVTPAEDEGRTAWFDWMTYTGGRHEGKPIRVELVTVPGQAHLNDRRRHLLAWGDVVVFVANTSAAAFGESVAKFGQLRADLDELGDAPIVVLANKRDLDDALELDQVRSELGLGEDDSLIEAIATSGGGIRQAFIFAVRAALTHPTHHDHTTNPTELLAHMQTALNPPSAPIAPADPQPETKPALETATIENQTQADKTQADKTVHETFTNVRLNVSAVPSGAATVVASTEWELVVAIANGLTAISADRGSPHGEVARAMLARGMILSDQTTAELSAEIDEISCWRLDDQVDEHEDIAPAVTVEPMVAPVPVGAPVSVATVPESAPEGGGVVAVAPTAASTPAADGPTRAEVDKTRATDERNARYRALRELRRTLRR